MWQQQFTWFFSHFQQEFRKSNPIAFEVILEATKCGQK
jgi:hypothetical protein